jgi:iron complex transport system substrate-binding protein
VKDADLLSPSSATEIVAELGLAESLVAVSEECDWSPEVGNLPVVTASRVDTAQLSSLEIEQAVRQQVSDGRPLYAIDGDLLETLEPDLILTQGLCAVCAVSADTVGELCATDAEVVALDAHTLAEIEKRIVWLGDLLGVAARGRMVAQEMEAKIATVSERVAGAPQRPVFVAEWLEPPYAAGHWIPEMVALAGGRDVLGRPGAPPPTRRPGSGCASTGPSWSSPPHAASTTSALHAKRRCQRWAAARSPSTPTPTTPVRARASPTA